MFREMRRFKQKLEIDECKKLLKSCKRAFLGVNGDDDFPYTLSINYYYDEIDNAIYFHSALTGHKIDSIKRNNKVSLSIIGEEYKDNDGYFYYVKSVVVFGKAQIVEDEDIRYNKLLTFGMKYFPSKEYTIEELKQSMARALLIKIDILHISGKLVHEK